VKKKKDLNIINNATSMQLQQNVSDSIPDFINSVQERLVFYMTKAVSMRISQQEGGGVLDVILRAQEHSHKLVLEYNRNGFVDNILLNQSKISRRLIQYRY
jgi:hypothetical protein